MELLKNYRGLGRDSKGFTNKISLFQHRLKILPPKSTPFSAWFEPKRFYVGNGSEKQLLK